MTVVTVGMVGNTLQPSLRLHLNRPAKTWIQRRRGRFGRTTGFGRTWGWPNPAQFRLAASSAASLRRLVNFGLIHRVKSVFLAHSYTSLVLDIVRLIYRLS
ncbi:hypothetical protein [Oryza sativa Japonica Group]|uniref:Uncharacterized protein n=1 Tax=Oryza sativa subsp. japonica TaxID=39947 RepID=Q9FP73_ORYSJ|nr:hypothetical protein [Oryza sativa Japonica Group]BAB64081.1 hypothetical protein [Oryza sativa Japonica Group]